ncbi:MAG: hypothetical protein AAFY72_02355 [Cyanobacteria bacterium J06649_4]
MNKIAILLSLSLLPASLSASLLAALPAVAQLAQTGSEPANASGCSATTPAELLSLTAAKNEARQMAEVTNGGIGLYRAEPAMYGSVVNAPCEVVSPGVWRFSFRGGAPVAVSTANTYTLLSVITVSGDSGRDRTINVEYNGPIAGYRPSSDRAPVTRPSAPVDIPIENTPPANTPPANVPEASTRGCILEPRDQIIASSAKNIARRAAETANGGLGVYRAERAMHGSVIEAPCELVSQDVFRFTFRGGDPVAVSTAEEYTVLSIVTVSGIGADRNVTIEYNGPIEAYRR